MNVTKVMLIKKIDRLNDYIGASNKFQLECGSQYTSWKLTNESGSHTYFYARSKNELARLIDAFREGVYYMENRNA